MEHTGQETDKTKARTNQNQWVILMCLIPKEYVAGQVEKSE